MIALVRKQLDAQLHEWRALQTVSRPSKGWLRSIRQALGMSTKQLAQKLHMSPQAISKLEHAEASLHVTLKTLENAASALNCRLVYALIPENTLEESVEKQMEKKADEITQTIHHSMSLEDQGTTHLTLLQEKQNLITSFKQKKNISFIWDEMK